MKRCIPVVVNKQLTCLGCGIPFSGPFAISEAEMIAIGSDLNKIHRPCGHVAILRVAQSANLHAANQGITQSAPPQPRVDYAGCVHRGEPSRLEECPTCSGRVQVKVFKCAVHGECQLEAKIGGINVCGSSCEQFSPPT